MYHHVRALVLYKPPVTALTCIRNINEICSWPLYQAFLRVCDKGSLDSIRAFHAEKIQPHFFPDPYALRNPLYSIFMGTVYCNLQEKQPADPTTRWFQTIAEEIHRPY